MTNFKIKNNLKVKNVKLVDFLSETWKPKNLK